MNSIIVTNNSIISESKNVIIKKNKITFLDSGNYLINYDKSNKVNLIFEINSDINVNLSEISFDNNLSINNSYVINRGYLRR